MIVAVLLSYAAPVQAIFAASASCCKGHACCRRAHGAGWMSRATCGSACGCDMAAPAANAVAARGLAHVAFATAGPRLMPPPPVRIATAPIAKLYQRPPPSC